MTPDLRDFQLDGGAGEAPAGVRARGKDQPSHSIQAVLDALAPAFGIAPERGATGSGTRRRTWLDTFDWRLDRAGLNLTYENARRGSRLLLTTRPDTVEAEQPTAGWQPRRPSLAEDLPAGPVRDRIERLAAPRALLPVATTSTIVTVHRLTNPDGKTVARLIVEASTVTQAGVTRSEEHTSE